MKPKLSKRILNQKFFLGICMVIVISLTMLQISVFGLPVTGKMATVTGKVTIVLPIPPLCKTNIRHIDHFFLGTKDNQLLFGTNQNDLIIGFKNPSIQGKAGDDCLFGGNGKNRMNAGPGNNV